MCKHTTVRNTKVIKIKRDRYLQTIKRCKNCHYQVEVSLKELT